MTIDAGGLATQLETYALDIGNITASVFFIIVLIVPGSIIINYF